MDWIPATLALFGEDLPPGVGAKDTDRYLNLLSRTVALAHSACSRMAMVFDNRDFNQTIPGV